MEKNTQEEKQFEHPNNKVIYWVFVFLLEIHSMIPDN